MMYILYTQFLYAKLRSKAASFLSFTAASPTCFTLIKTWRAWTSFHVSRSMWGWWIRGTSPLDQNCLIIHGTKKLNLKISKSLNTNLGSQHPRHMSVIPSSTHLYPSTFPTWPPPHGPHIQSHQWKPGSSSGTTSMRATWPESQWCIFDMLHKGFMWPSKFLL